MDESSERWMPVPGYEGYYEVSDHGQVRSLDRWVGGPWGPGTRRIAGRPISTFLGPDGYVRTNLWRDNRGAVPLVHRLVLLAFVGPAPAGTEALHGDDDPGNPCLSNLRWGTQSENNHDRVRHGTHHNATKTVCGPAAHELFPPNLMNSKDGGRRCLACDRARGRARWRGIQQGTPAWVALLDECYREIMAGAA